jgi:DNA (cytosine-5)-methyltransferase 1
MTLLPERILSGEVEAPDVFCGGTPCQAFSVAGLRNSLDDARGNLSLTFVGIANAIDHVRSVRRDDPAIIFWENVPGVLSTKDNAFGCFLGALAGEDDPIIPPGEKWTNAGCVYGPQRTVAWRVLDAQYFGVAQRRRRVFVVASARDKFDPAAVLFEFDGVRRDTAPSRQAGKKPTASLVPSVAGSLDTECGGGKLTHQSVANGHLIGTITARMFNALGFQDVQAGAIMAVVSPALNTCSGSHHAPDTKAYVVHGTQDPCVSDIAFAQGRNNGGENVLAYTTKMHNTTSNQAGKFYEEYSTSLDANSPPPAVFQPISIQDVRPIEKAQNGRGWNDDGTAYTVDTHATQGVAQPMVLMDQGGSVMNVEHDMVGTLRRETHGHEPVVMQPVVAMRESGLGYWMEDTVAGTLDANMGMSGHANRPAVMTVPQAMAVRRLTPVECERLQGFPDGYTNIPWRKKDESPDGPRYKALGNSWAVPVVRWIGRRIQEQINAA